MSQSDCLLQHGLPLGYGALCTPNGACPQLSACCLGGGQCEAVYWIQCIEDDGTFQGEGTPCTPTLCDPTAGAPMLQMSRNWGRIKAIYR